VIAHSAGGWLARLSWRSTGLRTCRSCSPSEAPTCKGLSVWEGSVSPSEVEAGSEGVTESSPWRVQGLTVVSCPHSYGPMSELAVRECRGCLGCYALTGTGFTREEALQECRGWLWCHVSACKGISSPSLFHAGLPPGHTWGGRPDERPAVPHRGHVPRGLPCAGGALRVRVGALFRKGAPWQGPAARLHRTAWRQLSGRQAAR